MGRSGRPQPPTKEPGRRANRRGDLGPMPPARHKYNHPARAGAARRDGRGGVCMLAALLTCLVCISPGREPQPEKSPVKDVAFIVGILERGELKEGSALTPTIREGWPTAWLVHDVAAADGAIDRAAVF